MSKVKNGRVKGRSLVEIINSPEELEFYYDCIEESRIKSSSRNNKEKGRRGKYPENKRIYSKEDV